MVYVRMTHATKTKLEGKEMSIFCSEYRTRRCFVKIVKEGILDRGNIPYHHADLLALGAGVVMSIM